MCFCQSRLNKKHLLTSVFLWVNLNCRGHRRQTLNVTLKCNFSPHVCRTSRRLLGFDSFYWDGSIKAKLLRKHKPRRIYTEEKHGLLPERNSVNSVKLTPIQVMLCMVWHSLLYLHRLNKAKQGRELLACLLQPHNDLYCHVDLRKCLSWNE